MKTFDWRPLWRLLVLITMAILAISCASSSGVKIHPSLSAGSEKGYVKFFALAGGAGGAGTSSLGGHRVALAETDFGTLLQPQYPFHSSNLSLLQPYLIVALPPGEWDFTITLGTDTARKVIPVSRDMITLVRLASRRTGFSFSKESKESHSESVLTVYFDPTKINIAHVRIPAHEGSFAIDPLPRDAAIYRELLIDPDSGVRHYAAARLGALRDRTAVASLEEALAKETDEATRNEIKRSLSMLVK